MHEYILIGNIEHVDKFTSCTCIRTCSRFLCTPNNNSNNNCSLWAFDLCFLFDCFIERESHIELAWPSLWQATFINQLYGIHIHSPIFAFANLRYCFSSHKSQALGCINPADLVVRTAATFSALAETKIKLIFQLLIDCWSNESNIFVEIIWHECGGVFGIHIFVFCVRNALKSTTKQSKTYEGIKSVNQAQISISICPSFVHLLVPFHFCSTRSYRVRAWQYANWLECS